MMLPLLLAIQEHAPAAKGALPAPFSPTPGLIIWTWVVFAALLFILAKFVLPLIVKAGAEREQAIAKNLADAETMRTDVASALEEQRELLAGARGEAAAIMNEARQAAERERTQGVERTRAEQEEMLSRARQEIATERDRAIAELRRETVDLAIAAAARVVGKSLDAATDRKIVEDYLSGIGKTQ